MERDNSQFNAESIPPCDTYTYEQFALQALVDRLFTESDARVHFLFNQIHKEATHE